ncbi:MAG: FHA domain-containing protein [Pseudomonadota bacterium]
MRLFSKFFRGAAKETAPEDMTPIKPLADVQVSAQQPSIAQPTTVPKTSVPAPKPELPAAQETKAAPVVADAAPQPNEPAIDQIVEAVIDRSGGPTSGSVNIWDIVVEDAEHDIPSDTENPAKPDAAQATSARNLPASQTRRNRTRLLGFDTSDGGVVDLFDAQPQDTPNDRVQFPVGWLLVVAGPGRGHCFALLAGMSQIGRGTDQTVQLDFGDAAISRNNHAAIVFDEGSNSFTLGHGGKANIVRLNGKPVIANEALSDGDKIKIGDTTLQLKTLCDKDFSWSADERGDEEHEDVAIA